MKRLVARDLLAGWVLIVAMPGFSQVYETVKIVEAQSYLSFMPFGIDQDKDREVYNGRDYGARITYGHIIRDDWFWEAQLAYNRLASESGRQNIYQTHLGGDAIYRFGEYEQFRPFVLVGGGAVYDDHQPRPGIGPQEPEGLSPFMNLGMGFVSRQMGEAGLRVRAEARYVQSWFDDGFGDWHYGLGVELPIGGGQIVSRTGLNDQAAPMVVAENAQVKSVSASVMPRNGDSNDTDGVGSTMDRCPATLSGVGVDNSGCAMTQQGIWLEGAYYVEGSSRLTASSGPAITRLVEFMMGDPLVSITIEAHGDMGGTFDDTQKLRRELAEELERHLVSRGIEPSRIKLIPFAGRDEAARNFLPRGKELEAKFWIGW